MLEKSDQCDMCGTSEWEWKESRFAYTPEEKFCPGCYAKSVFTDQEGSSLAGTTVELVPTTKMLTAQRKVKAMKAAERRRKQRQDDNA
jgi:hypothetical protein